MNPTGFFRKVPKQPGRDRLRQKLAPFISHFDELETQLSAKLSESNFKPNDDIIAMVSINKTHFNSLLINVIKHKIILLPGSK